MRELFPLRRFLPMLGFIFLALACDTNSTASPKGIIRPLPDRVVTLRIVMSNGTWFIASQRERGLINVQAQNWSLNVSPHCYENGNVIAEVTGRVGRRSLTESLEINKQRPTSATGRNSLPGIHIVTIQLIDIAPAKNIISAASGGAACCVSCSGVEVCGCAVEAPCGSCCTGACCS